VHAWLGAVEASSFAQGIEAYTVEWYTLILFIISTLFFFFSSSVFYSLSSLRSVTCLTKFAWFNPQIHATTTSLEASGMRTLSPVLDFLSVCL
jgi:hypothetical protein